VNNSERRAAESGRRWGKNRVAKGRSEAKELEGIEALADDMVRAVKRVNVRRTQTTCIRYQHPSR